MKILSNEEYKELMEYKKEFHCIKTILHRNLRTTPICRDMVSCQVKDFNLELGCLSSTIVFIMEEFFEKEKKII